VLAMITLDNLRNALRNPMPWTEMDKLVRAEQASGRKVTEILQELQALVEPVRELENPSENADDAMMDTLDALMGNCHPSCRYTDSPDTNLPSEAENWIDPNVAVTKKQLDRGLPDSLEVP
jgi:hypothetical protein